MNNIQERLRELLAIDKIVDMEELSPLLEKYGAMIEKGEVDYQDAEMFIGKLCLQTTINLTALSMIAYAMTRSVNSSANDSLKEDLVLIIAIQRLLNIFALGRMKSILNLLMEKEGMENERGN